mmetsp:Transcript_23092/g.75768  ORF Transcript_23092/g.75768 Transcript_23092/m.75768 type:complete len:237 (-) Transcript_23092:658-1368(-)
MRPRPVVEVEVARGDVEGVDLHDVERRVVRGQRVRRIRAERHEVHQLAPELHEAREAPRVQLRLLRLLLVVGPAGQREERDAEEAPVRRFGGGRGPRGPVVVFDAVRQDPVVDALGPADRQGEHGARAEGREEGPQPVARVLLPPRDAPGPEGVPGDVPQQAAVDEQAASQDDGRVHERNGRRRPHRRRDGHVRRGLRVEPSVPPGGDVRRRQPQPRLLPLLQVAEGDVRAHRFRE